MAQLDVRDFGATGDGHALDTRAFQRAIDACSHSGGGIVEVPPRTYVIGTVYLKSGVTLHLAEGAVLLGSTNPKDYGLVDSFKDAVNRVRGFTLIGAIDAQDVRITGKGTVDGRGIELQKNGNGPDARPFLVRWVRCRGVEISDVELKNSAAWTMHFFQCQDANVSGVRIDSFGVDNNDGIDIDSSQRITVEDCTIFSEDDSICIKTTSVVPSMQIRVRNCTLRTHHGAMKIGTESMGDIEDVVFSQCRVIDAREGAIKFCSEDGANIRN
ncbi:MAG: glycosyl hydrolase family 28 protein, partial [Silvibacterium sp.]